MKLSLEIHKRNLLCERDYAAHKQVELERLQNEIIRSQARSSLLAKQVEEAERRGMDSFDSDRFLVRRPKKEDSDA